MKKKLIATAVLLSIGVSSIAQDLPLNPKTGECYIKCIDKEKGLSKWTNAPCNLLQKDSIQIKALQYKLINLGYTVETTGYIDLETIDAYKDLNNNSKKLKRKLKNEKRNKKK